jgi:3-phosphoshikimate 1-carboxyvinyltransferase
MGVDIESSAGCAPLTLKPSPRLLNAIDYTLPVASAQVKSCLLLAALAAGGPSLLREPGPSRDHTERMLRRLGVEVRSEAVDLNGSFGDQGSVAYVTHLIPPDPLRLKPFEVHLPGDFSAAAFLIVAALVTPGSEITLRGVGLNPTRTGLLEALGGMGAEIQIINQMERDGEPVGDLLVRHSRLQGGRVAGDLVVRMIDEFPAFAVAAACAGGRTEVAQAGELRHKESDRIASLAGELRKLGVPVSETPDGFAIQGGAGIRGGLVEAHGDHRLGMALVVAGLAAQEPVTVQGTSIIAESFPGFLQALSSLGAKLTPPG